MKKPNSKNDRREDHSKAGVRRSWRTNTTRFDRRMPFAPARQPSKRHAGRICPARLTHLACARRQLREVEGAEQHSGHGSACTVRPIDARTSLSSRFTAGLLGSNKTRFEVASSTLSHSSSLSLMYHRRTTAARQASLTGKQACGGSGSRVFPLGSGLIGRTTSAGIRIKSRQIDAPLQFLFCQF